MRKNRKNVVKITISTFSMAVLLTIAGCQGASETKEPPTEQEQASEPAGGQSQDENGVQGQDTIGDKDTDARSQEPAEQETPGAQSQDAAAPLEAPDTQGQESADAQQSDAGGTQNTAQGGSQSEQGGAGQISLDEAKQTALDDAGVASDAATFTKEKLDYDDGVSVYEIEFYTEAGNYEYEIDAATGAIVSRSEETHHNNSGHSSHSNTEHAILDSEAVKSIAAGQAGVSVEEVQFTKVKQDSEDGYAVYEVEFTKDGKEYEYTIDAATGAVLEFEVD